MQTRNTRYSDYEIILHIEESLDTRSLPAEYHVAQRATGQDDDVAKRAAELPLKGPEFHAEIVTRTCGQRHKRGISRKYAI